MADIVREGITEDELMQLGSDARVEIVDGEIVEMSPVGGLHHVIVGNANRLLDPHVVANNLGAIFVDGLIFLLHKKGRHLRGARVPDLSFIRTGDIPSDWDIQRPFPGAPTLAIEVVSPDDQAEEVLKRVRDYLNAGTEQTWVMYPDLQEIHQYHRDRSPEMVRIYRGDEIIDADDLFPGLRLVASDFFKLPAWVK